MGLPFMKTRILTDDEKEDRHRYMLVSTKSVLVMCLGLLLTTALKPLLLWAALTAVLQFQLSTEFLYLIFLAFVPLVALSVVGLWPLHGAQKRLKYKKLVKTAPRGRRVKWAAYWRLVGTALGPLPIQVVLAITSVCLFGTILLSASVGDVYLTDIVNMAVFCLLLGPAIPAGLRSKRIEDSEQNI